MFVGITFPFFGALLGFFGGFAFAPTTYFVSPSKILFLIMYILYAYDSADYSAIQILLFFMLVM